MALFNKRPPPKSTNVVLNHPLQKSLIKVITNSDTEEADEINTIENYLQI